MAPKIIDLRNNQLSIILRDWLDAFRGDKADCEKTFSCPEAFKVLLRSNPIYCDCNMQVKALLNCFSLPDDDFLHGFLSRTEILLFPCHVRHYHI